MGGFGFGMGPNGQMGPVYVVSGGDDTPSEYEGHFLTPQNIAVTATIHTSNKALADQVVADLALKMNWSVTEKADRPIGLIASVTLVWVFSALAAFVTPFVVFFVALILDSADFTQRAADIVADHGARWGVIGFVILGVVLTVVEIIDAIRQRGHQSI